MNNSDPEPYDVNKPTVNCQTCHEDENLPEKVYNIELLDFSQALLSALQSINEFVVYTTFDPETEHCVVDNCPNVNIVMIIMLFYQNFMRN